MIGKFFNALSKKSSGTETSGTPEYKRFNDAVLVIAQDNHQKLLPVKACNERAIKLIGYSEAEILSLDLRELLPTETRDIINDYIEFSDSGKRIDEILGRIPNFRLIGSRGRNVPVSLRVVRGVSDADHTTYRIVMTDTSLMEVLQQARIQYPVLKEKEHLLRDMQQVINHGSTFNYESSFAVISFFDGESHVKRINKMIESSKRNTDIIGPWNESTLIYIMPDTPIGSSAIPLQRFKSSLPDDLQSRLIIRYGKTSHNIVPAVQIRDCAEGRLGMSL